MCPSLVYWWPASLRGHATPNQSSCLCLQLNTPSTSHKAQEVWETYAVAGTRSSLQHIRLTKESILHWCILPHIAISKHSQWTAILPAHRTRVQEGSVKTMLVLKRAETLPPGERNHSPLAGRSPRISAWTGEIVRSQESPARVAGAAREQPWTTDKWWYRTKTKRQQAIRENRRNYLFTCGIR